MKYLPYVLLVLAVAFLAYFGFFGRATTDLQTSQKQIDPKNVIQDQMETQTDDQAGIIISVTPTALSTAHQEWKFNVVMDTHSVALDQDMASITVLVDDKGREYLPLRWEGAAPGGHHREGTVVFRAIDPTPASLELEIAGVGGVPQRSFKWSLE